MFDLQNWVPGLNPELIWIVKVFLIALATASFLHLSAAFQSVSAESNSEAANLALKAIRKPMWIAAATTAIGYASLSLSSVPIVREFGLTLAVGMIGTGVIGTVLLPALLALAPDERRCRVKKSPGGKARA